MALITYTASSKGASVTLTVDDATSRAIGVDVSATSRQMRIGLLDAQGRLSREITPTPNTAERTIIDIPARLVEIQKADATSKSYLCPSFAVFF